MRLRPWGQSRKMRREILIEKAVLNVLRGALGVELWLFYYKPKNFGSNVIYSPFVSERCILLSKIPSFKQDSLFFGSAVPAGACRAPFASCKSKAACKFSQKLAFFIHFKAWDLSRKMRREILIEKDVLNVLRDALGVELWLFYCKPKNFGPNVIYFV